MHLVYPWGHMIDGAEICELVGLYILNKLERELKANDIGLYRAEMTSWQSSRTTLEVKQTENGNKSSASSNL